MLKIGNEWRKMSLFFISTMLLKYIISRNYTTPGVGVNSSGVMIRAINFSAVLVPISVYVLTELMKIFNWKDY